MIQRLAINGERISAYTELKFETPAQLEGFPFIAIDEDSYIVSADIVSGIDFDIKEGQHCISIGKGCAIADNITLMLNANQNHDYASVSQGDVPFLADVNKRCRMKRKGSIIIQNDVWIGRKATITSSVTLGNGCVVAANSVVTKDVPPYAIVGGNPARIIRYRFDEEVIDGLQKIAWWDWSREEKLAHKEDFALDPSEFVEKYLPEAIARINECKVEKYASTERKRVLLFPDFREKHTLYPRIIREFCSAERIDLELFIFISKEDATEQNLVEIEKILNIYQEKECYISIQSDENCKEETLFQLADYYVTTRGSRLVHRTCLSDRYKTKVLYGTDDYIFERC